MTPAASWGWTPFVPYLLVLALAFPIAVAVTGLAFFLAGASRRLLTDRGPVRASGESGTPRSTTAG